MAILEMKGISISFDDRDILKKINLIINEYERIGVVGYNGGGKTTLVNILTGVLEPDEGVVVKEKNCSVGYLKQSCEYNYDDYTEIFKNTDGEFYELNSQLNLRNDIELTKDRLKSLSGGERTKLLLSDVLARKPKVLVLDEPTNHLDIESIEWLITELNNYYGTVIVVSHDRYFLNKTANKIIDVKDKSIKEYVGNYDDYKKCKELEEAQILKTYEAQVSTEKKLNKEIDRLKNWTNKGEKQARRQGGMISDSKIKGAKTKAQMRAKKISSQAKSKTKRLEQMTKDFIEKPKVIGEIRFAFKSDSIGSKILVSAENLSKSFNGKELFSKGNFHICKREKIGLIGENGSGKTTLINIILGNINYDGFLWKSPTLKIAYISQDIYDLDSCKSICDLASVYPKHKKELFFSNLINMNINRNTFTKKIKFLSMGERMRIKIAQIIVEDYNMLILDEPTNHLDLPNKEHLESTLKLYEGTVVIATHDRYALESITDKLLICSDNEIKKVDMGYGEYINNLITKEK